MNSTYENLRHASEIPVDTVMENINVICADDNKDTLALMKFKCEELGWHGVYVETALDIIDAINNSCTDFDAIITDINFNTKNGPDITGITVARTIRKVRPNVPIMFVSGYVNTITREEVRRVNAEVMTKPVDQDKLFDQIASMIYWHRLASSDFYLTKKDDRRKSSINRTDWARRRSDCQLVPSQLLIDTLTGVKNADG